MKLNEVKILTIIISIFIISTVWLSYFRGIINSDSDNQFLAMGIIGVNNNIENYYINNNTEIALGAANHWNISVTNSMDDIQYLDIKVKIWSLNGPYNDTLPNSVELIPSNATTVYDLPFFLARGDTTYHEFTWTLANSTKITPNDKTIGISTNITINNSKYPIELNLPRIPSNIPGASNYAYSRIIFELWAYNGNTNTFNFKVETPSKEFCIWNQLFFKIKL